MNTRHVVGLIAGLSLGCAVCSGLSGCKSTPQTGTSAGGTSYAIDKDGLSGLLSSDLATAYEAAKKVTTDDLLYQLSYDAMDAREAIIDATTARGYAVRVELTRKSDQITDVLVMIEPKKDDAAEMEFFNRLEARVAGDAASMK